MLRILLAAAMSASVYAKNLTNSNGTTNIDSYLWLEDIQSPKSLEWVQNRNNEAIKSITADKNFDDLKKAYINILNKKDFVQIWRNQDSVYYYKKDQQHPRGQVLKIARNQFKGENSNWQVLIDLDDLSKKDNTSYIFQSFNYLKDSDLALVFLSVQGRDETIVREFNFKTGEFVKDGFKIPLSKTSANFLDSETVLLSYNEGPDSLTRSNYPRRVRYWKRGEKITEAKLIAEFPQTMVGSWVSNCRLAGKNYGIVTANEENGDSKFFSLDEVNLKLREWPTHPNAQLTSCLQDKIIFFLEKDWTLNGVVYPRNSYLALQKTELEQGKIQSVEVVFQPDGKIFPQEIAKTKNKLLMTAFEDAKPTLFSIQFADGKWNLVKIPSEKGSEYSISWSDEDLDDVWFNIQGYSIPKKLVEMNLTSLKKTNIQKQKVNFSLKDIEIKNQWATSKDGTKVPYTIVALKQTTQASRPTILYGYGGFRVSMTPMFSEGQFQTWIRRGGVFVHTNLRGGLEFGEEWHEAAMRDKKQNVFDDFIAVAEDLIQNKVTTADQLAIQGGSNGGLLVSAVAVQRPELFKAVVCQVPLTDMLRFHKLLAGSSWIYEYGDPDNSSDRVFLEKYSPYQNLKNNMKMPKILFLTSTNDDRVHPGHARKMAAKMLEYGQEPLFYEEMEGGHGGGLPVEKRAYNAALIPAFLSGQLNLQTPVDAN